MSATARRRLLRALLHIERAAVFDCGPPGRTVFGHRLAEAVFVAGEHARKFAAQRRHPQCGLASAAAFGVPSRVAIADGAERHPRGHCSGVRLNRPALLRPLRTRSVLKDDASETVLTAVDRLRQSDRAERRQQQKERTFHDSIKLAGMTARVGALACGSAHLLRTVRRAGGFDDVWSPAPQHEATRSGCRHGMRRIALALLLMAPVAASLVGCSDQKAKFTGIWKSNCKDYWGLQIRPNGDGLYSVTFCGLSGCLAPGEWMPDTHIEADPRYQIISSTKIRIKSNNRGYFTYTKCSADPFWQARNVGD